MQPGIEQPSQSGAIALPILTERLLLRDFVPEDWQAVRAYASDPEVARFMFWPPRDEAASRAYVDRMVTSQAEQPRLIYALAVVRRADRRLIGECDLTLDAAAAGDLGYALARDVWGE